MIASAQMPSYLVEPLSDQHDRQAFSCGIEALDHYFRHQVGPDTRRGVACAYVLVGIEDRRLVAGYYTLSSTVIPLGEFPPAVAKRLPRYPVLPATLLGRLAISQTHQGQNLGEYLLMDALALSFRQSRKVASLAVVVDAKNEAARGFYLQYGFIPFLDPATRLFLPMKTIARLVSRLL